MSGESKVAVELVQHADYRFDVAFGEGVPALRVDEPAPLGLGTGPSPVQLLCAAVGSCLSDSLLFALRKFKQSPEPLRCEVVGEVGRNEQGRLRVLRIDATLVLGVPAARVEHLQRALDQFEAFCTVTQSVGQGVPVHVHVRDADGQALK